MTERLVLEIEVQGFNVDGVAEMLRALVDDDHYTVLDVVTEEWMRPEVGLTLVSRPGEKSMNDDFEVNAMNGRIIGARIQEQA